MTIQTIIKGQDTAFLMPAQPEPVKYHSFIQKVNPSKSGQTIFLQNPPVILGGASVVSPKEGKGPLKDYFRIVSCDKKTDKNFECSEKNMLKNAIVNAVKNSNLSLNDINLLLSGDLLNQITSSSFAARDLGLPFMGLYSACSTMTQSLVTASLFLNAGYYTNIACATASHFATAERQYRYPLEYGAQKPAYAQWTVTGAGCAVLSSSIDDSQKLLNYPRIKAVTAGKVIDYGINDTSNMGAAMAPAAFDTLIKMFNDTDTSPDDYDLILTGDLGKLGSDILRDLTAEQGIKLGQNYNDCGCMVYNLAQKVYQGGSGAGCCASVFNSFVLEKLKSGEYKRVLFLATGALMSPQSSFQGETIPGISHGVIIENSSL